MVAFEVPHIPPSMNDIVGQGTRWRYTKAKRDWTAILKPAIVRAGLEPCDRIVAVGEITFPTRAKHDQGNYRFMLEKALGDVLQDGWLPDDSWDHYEFSDLTCRYEKGVRRTRICLMPESLEDAA
jgi:hypothetical protein